MAGYIGSKASVVSSGAERKKVITATAGQTAFTGLTYSPNRVHVFQNGVRLVDGTDYTATDGTSLTLTVGASADDQVVVVSYSGFQTSDTVSSSAGGTFTGDVNFTGAFTSQGIDDNATSTAMTLDGSGNLLVGKTSTAFNTAGFELFGNADKGKFWATRDGGVAAAFNRKTSDGDIALFAKDGSTVGSIGTALTPNREFLVESNTGQLLLGVSSSSNRVEFDGSQLYPSPTSSANLGHPNVRWQDAYLSGGVFLGGTGSSNKLDDYEEGTFLPGITYGGTSATMSNQGGQYVKIGRLVHAWFRTTTSNLNSGTGDIRLTNLPFTASGDLSYYHGCVQGNSYMNLPTGAGSIQPYVEQNTTVARLLYMTNTSHADITHSTLPVNATLFGMVTYSAAS